MERCFLRVGFFLDGSFGDFHELNAAFFVSPSLCRKIFRFSLSHRALRLELLRLIVKTIKPSRRSSLYLSTLYNAFCCGRLFNNSITHMTVDLFNSDGNKEFHELFYFHEGRWL